MMKLSDGQAPFSGLVEDITGLLAGLHPDEALSRLAPLWADAPAGSRRRALLGARIALMRQAMVAEPVVLAEPEVAEVLPEPVFVPLPVAKPAALNRGAMMLLNLEDAAKMLLGADDDDDTSADLAEDAADAGQGVPEGVMEGWDGSVSDPEPAPESAPEPAPESGPESGPVERAVVVAELAEIIAAEAAGGLAKSKARAPKAKRGAEAKAAVPTAASVVLPDLSAQFGALEADGEVTPAPPKKPKVAFDLSAQFAAMEGD